MPILTDNELQAAIANGQIGAISLDTSVFDQFGCNLTFKALLRLDQFKNTPIQVVISEVTVGEVREHIARDASAEAGKLRAALNHYRKAWRRPEQPEAMLAGIDLDESSADFAEAQWDAYAGATGATVIPAEGLAATGEILRRYFASEPPFGEKDAKKHEFPDAFALLSLEAWAEQVGTMVLAVSRDGDWAAYAATSPRIVYIESLPKALDHFNRDARFATERLVARLSDGEAPGFREELERAINNYLDTSVFEPDATSNFYVDSDPSFAVLIGMEVEGGPDIVAAYEDDVTFTLSLDCTIDFSAEFALSVRDGIDKDYVRLDTITKEVQRQETIQVTVTCSQAMDPEPDVYDVEVTPKRLHVDFGRVELDWGDEE